MQFTLCLSDYVDQYSINQETGDTHCPVCYEQVMTADELQDVQHLLECYKDHRLMLRIRQYYRECGVLSTMPLQDLEQLARDEQLRCAKEISNLVRPESDHL